MNRIKMKSKFAKTNIVQMDSIIRRICDVPENGIISYPLDVKEYERKLFYLKSNDALNVQVSDTTGDAQRNLKSNFE